MLLDCLHVNGDMEGGCFAPVIRIPGMHEIFDAFMSPSKADADMVELGGIAAARMNGAGYISQDFHLSDRINSVLRGERLDDLFNGSFGPRFVQVHPGRPYKGDICSCTGCSVYDTLTKRVEGPHG
jgi:hypothetical protein